MPTDDELLDAYSKGATHHNPVHVSALRRVHEIGTREAFTVFLPFIPGISGSKAFAVSSEYHTIEEAREARDRVATRRPGTPDQPLIKRRLVTEYEDVE